MSAGQIECKTLAAQEMTKLNPGGSQAIVLYREDLCLPKTSFAIISVTLLDLRRTPVIAKSIENRKRDNLSLLFLFSL